MTITEAQYHAAASINEQRRLDQLPQRGQQLGQVTQSQYTISNVSTSSDGWHEVGTWTNVTQSVCDANNVI
ncbi:MAG: hypothetical protein H6514_09615 [Acidimicrobiaceae bacterium]|nr:hypothetical protein [Acidimicrobiaceae bacterium]